MRRICHAIFGHPSHVVGGSFEKQYRVTICYCFQPKRGAGVAMTNLFPQPTISNLNFDPSVNASATASGEAGGWAVPKDD